MSRINRLALSLFVIGASAVGVSARAYATTSNASVTVSADVTNVCTISAGPLSFGNYDPTLNATQDGTAVLNVKCTAGAATTIDLGQGSNPATGSTDAAPARQLKYTDTSSVSHLVSYQLYQDSAHTTVWATGASVNKAYTGTGADDTVTVYGRIAAGQTSSPAGTYSDTISAIINF